MAKIDIGYAKTAKRIDVKKLKASMWSLLTTSKSDEDKVRQVFIELTGSLIHWGIWLLLYRCAFYGVHVVKSQCPRVVHFSLVDESWFVRDNII